MKKFISVIMVLMLIMSTYTCFAEDFEDVNDDRTFIVTATRLNGRNRPNKKARVETIFDYGDKLIPTGKWSKNHQWVEVEGGESGTVWVHIEYVTEQMRAYKMKNIHTGKVKIRQYPVNGKLTGYLKKGQEVWIEQMVLGWGKSEKGWIDMKYLEEVINE